MKKLKESDIGVLVVIEGEGGINSCPRGGLTPSFEIVTTTTESNLPEISDDDIERIAVEMVNIIPNSRSSEL